MASTCLAPIARAGVVIAGGSAPAALAAHLLGATWRAVRAPGSAGPDAAVGLAAAAALVVVALWFAMVVTAFAVDGARLARTRATDGDIAPKAHPGWHPDRLRRCVVAFVATAAFTLPAGATALAAPTPRAAANVAAGAAAATSRAIDVADPVLAVADPVLAVADPVLAVADPLLPRWVPDPPPAPAVTAATFPAPRPRQVGGDEDVVVRRGDTLWAITARHLGDGTGAAEVLASWPAWYAANRLVIGADPDLLLPGQRLRPPTADELELTRSTTGGLP